MGCSYLLGAVLVLATAASDLQRSRAAGMYCEPQELPPYRRHQVSLADFCAVGDGATLNTKAFHDAVLHLSSFGNDGGAELFVPAGRWLTGSFGLISHLTLSLDADAVIIGSRNLSDWPLVDPLPSYGVGRELQSKKRYQSLIYGSNLTDVTITGANGTIDGNGDMWWNLVSSNTLMYTRPHIIELMYSTEVVISNITIKDNPYWAVHPVYCSEVLVQYVTILAPPSSQNTNGIIPDSCTNVCIQDCYVSTGDDAFGIKSGWDEYGISFAHPSRNISIRRAVGAGSLGAGAGIAFGSEMSGGISDVSVEALHITNSSIGIMIKTKPGRGGYIRNLHIADVRMTNVDTAIGISSNYDEDPDAGYNKSALPLISNITIKDVVGTNINEAGFLEGIQGDVFMNICLLNITLDISSNLGWQCEDVEGYSSAVSPEPCKALLTPALSSSSMRLVNPLLKLLASLVAAHFL